MISNGKGKGAERNLRAFFICGLLLLAADAWAETRPSPLTDPYEQSLLDAFLAGKPDPADVAHGGVTAQTLALLGREDLVLHQFPGHARYTCNALMENGQAVDPVVTIAAKAMGARVTMINEAHDMPQTRSFAAKIAAALRPQGYAVYAGEAFTDQIGATAPSWPLMTDGRLVNDPIYGRLVRSLRALGYRLVPYEDTQPAQATATPQERMAQREIVQAQNLEARLKAAPATAKLLVHVGYAHLDKSATSPVKMMAGHFRDDTGIDPLTVDQTQFYSKTGRYEICDTTRLAVSDPSAIYVGMPTPTFTRHRPNWRLAEGDKFADIPDTLRRPSEAAIYEARLANEPDTAVPVDRILVRPGEDDMPLLLPPGRYRVAVWTEKGGWSADVPVTVN